MPAASTTEQIEGIRQQTITVLDELMEKAEEFELAEPPPTLEQYRRKLRENTYKVLVVGEAKRGKSTFVNALIGRDLLPTDVDVATSQVFRIKPSQHEAYRLRFEDGSQQEIAFEDLPLYGSQVMADAGVVPTTDRIIRWIEADVPIRFLPENLIILDTPGTGALYAGHAQITHRFVPEADAVVFVLESGQPAGEADQSFIEEILGVTRNIFFIQTKIDEHGKEDWQAVQRRNQEILVEKFGKRLVDTRVWPISSTNLRKAVSGDTKIREAYLAVSRHDELSTALRKFLARVTGWDRTAKTMLAAAQYHALGRKALSGRLAGVGESSEQKRAELQRAAMQYKQQFDADWGVSGRKLGQLKEEIQKSIAVGKQGFARYIQPGGGIERAQQARIDEIASLEEANRVAKKMPSEVTSAAINRWSLVCEGVQRRCADLLGVLAEAADAVSAPVKPDLSGFTIPDSGPNEEFKRDYFTMLRGVLVGGSTLGGISAVATYLLPNVWVTALVPPASIVAAPAVVFLVAKGLQDAIRGEVESARQELSGRLGEMLLRVQGYFFDEDLTSGQFGLVDEYFKRLERTMNEQIQDLVRRKSHEANAEIVRLTEAAALDDQQREAQSKRIREQLAEWDEVGKATNNVMEQIKGLEEARIAEPVTA